MSDADRIAELEARVVGVTGERDTLAAVLKQCQEDWGRQHAKIDELEWKLENKVVIHHSGDSVILTADNWNKVENRIKELQALVLSLNESLTGCNENNRKFAERFRDHLALVDGLREMADELEEPEHPNETGYWAGYDDGRKSCATELRALLDKESEE